MSIQARPLTTKLFAVTLVMLTTVALVLTWRSYQGISGLSTELTQITETSLKESLTQRLSAEVTASNEKIKGFLNTAYHMALSMRDITASK